MDGALSATNTDTAVMKTLDEFGVSKLEVGSNENKQTNEVLFSLSDALYSTTSLA